MKNIKTLKDLTIDMGAMHHAFCQGNNIPNEYEESQMVAVVNLRQEAIKWINEGLSEKKNAGAIAWIKHFFNISEEDLK
jgi:hypothetical protein